MGTIQPSRFLSHSGQILPGVRRVVKVPNPAAGNNWTVNVPAGVQWYVIGGVTTLTTDAVVVTRTFGVTVTVDDVVVWSVLAPGTQAASLTASYNLMSAQSPGSISADAGGQIVPLPSGALPQGASIASSVVGLDAADTLTATALWVEEYYFTDAQLSEIERDIARTQFLLAQAEASANAQLGGKL